MTSIDRRNFTPSAYIKEDAPYLKRNYETSKSHLVSYVTTAFG